MRRGLLLLLAAGLLAGCGADGPPEAPAARTGVSVGVSGSASLGVVGS